jgi:flagellar biosynthesis protein FlhB
MILKIFSPKKLAQLLAFLLKLVLAFFKNLILTLVFEKNWQKLISQPRDVKTRIITKKTNFQRGQPHIFMVLGDSPAYISDMTQIDKASKF